MKNGKKAADPKWPVVWGFDGNMAGRMKRQDKIGRLALGIRQELNRR